MVLLLYYLQNLDAEVNPLIADLEQSNALALAIVTPGSEFMMQGSLAISIKRNFTISRFELMLSCAENAFTLERSYVLYI